ncbi:MAG: magnesium/cobalt transporter CorA [Planctomycetota bacterium]
MKRELQRGLTEAGEAGRELGRTVGKTFVGVGTGVGDAVGEAVGMVGGSVVGVGEYVGGMLGRGVKRTVRTVMPRREVVAEKARPGSSAGMTADQLAAMERSGEPVTVATTDYGAERAEVHSGEGKAGLREPKPDWAAVRWVDVRGLGDPSVLAELTTRHGLHPLAMEDVVHTFQRPKVEPFEVKATEDRTAEMQLFIVVKMMRAAVRDGVSVIDSEQVSLFLLGDDRVVTVQEKAGDCWDAIRERLQKAGTKLRGQDGSFLLYALLDAVVDAYFPVLEHYSDRLDRLEEAVYKDASQAVINELHALKRELLMMRRQVWPMRELLQQLQKEEDGLVSETARLYLRDVYDHVVQVIDLVETSRDLATGLADTWMSAVSNRMNEVMKVLALMGALFLPISFLAGVFGMNFEWIPGIGEPWGFAVFCGASLAVVVGMLVWFKVKRWL